jgi:hypothetical protein
MSKSTESRRELSLEARMMDIDPRDFLSARMSTRLAIEGSSKVISQLAKFYGIPDELEDLRWLWEGTRLNEYERGRRHNLIRLVFAQARHWQLIANAIVEAIRLKSDHPAEAKLCPSKLKQYRAGLEKVGAAFRASDSALTRWSGKNRTKRFKTPARDRITEDWNEGNRLIKAALSPDTPRSRKLSPTYDWTLDEHPTGDLQRALGLGRTQFYQLRKRFRIPVGTKLIPFKTSLTFLRYRLRNMSREKARDFVDSAKSHQPLADLQNERARSLDQLLRGLT